MLAAVSGFFRRSSTRHSLQVAVRYLSDTIPAHRRVAEGVPEIVRSQFESAADVLKIVESQRDAQLRFAIGFETSYCQQMESHKHEISQCVRQVSAQLSRSRDHVFVEGLTKALKAQEIEENIPIRDIPPWFFHREAESMLSSTGLASVSFNASLFEFNILHNPYPSEALLSRRGIWPFNSLSGSMPNNGYQITLTSSLPMFLFCNLGLSNEQRELISFLSVIATESVRVVMPKNIKFKNQEAFIAALFKPGLEAAHSCTDGYSSKFTIDNPTLVLPEEYFSACSDRGAIEEQLAVMGVHTKFPIDFTPFDRMPISSDRLINLFHKLELLEESLLALDSGTDQASKLEGVMQEIEMEQKRLEGFRPDQARHCLRFQILPSYPIY